MNRFRAVFAIAALAALFGLSTAEAAWSQSVGQTDDLKPKTLAPKRLAPVDHGKAPSDVGGRDNLGRALGIGAAVGIGGLIIGNTISQQPNREFDCDLHRAGTNLIECTSNGGSVTPCASGKCRVMIDHEVMPGNPVLDEGKNHLYECTCGN